jgi:hypothetical protein
MESEIVVKNGKDLMGEKVMFHIKAHSGWDFVAKAAIAGGIWMLAAEVGKMALYLKQIAENGMQK